MKFLVDESVSPLVARVLRNAGHDASHISDYGLQGSPDPLVFQLAATEDRILVSADTDFVAILALRREIKTVVGASKNVPLFPR